MAVLAGAVVSERWLDEVVIQATKANVGADVSDKITLPAGLGDVAIMEMSLFVSTEATPVSTVELGWYANVEDAGATTILDIIGTGKIWKISATGAAGYISPDPLVLWRQNERVAISYPELDSNGAPTDDHIITIKCVRVRPTVVAGGPQVLQLVR